MNPKIYRQQPPVVSTPPPVTAPIQPAPVMVSAPLTHPVNQITPLSKYLALGLFIILPFLGAYIGYRLAPEQVNEVQQNIIVSVPEEGVEEANESAVVSEVPLRTFTDTVFGFSFEYPAEWGEVEVDVYEGDCAKTVETACQERKYRFVRSDDGSSAHFMTAQNNSFQVKDGDGRDGNWGDVAKTVNEDYVSKCELFEDCVLRTSKYGIDIASTYHTLENYGDETGDQPADYFYEMYKPDINVGLILSSQNLVNEEDYEVKFMNTVVDSFAFLERY